MEQTPSLDRVARARRDDGARGRSAGRAPRRRPRPARAGAAARVCRVGGAARGPVQPRARRTLGHGAAGPHDGRGSRGGARADTQRPAGPARGAGGTRRLRRVPRAGGPVRRRDVRRLHVPGRHVGALRADRLHHGARHRHRGPRAVELPARHADAAGERIPARPALRAGHVAPGARHRRGPRLSAVHRVQHRARGPAGRAAARGSRDPETARVRGRRRGAGRLPALLVRAPGRDQGDGHDLLHPAGGRAGGGGGQGT